MVKQYRDAFIQIDLKWKKHLIDINLLLKAMEPKVYQATSLIKSRAAFMASGPALLTGSPLGQFRVRVLSGNYRKLMFVRTRIEGKSIRAEIGSAAIGKGNVPYPVYVEGYTQNFRKSLEEEWKKVSEKIYNSIEKIIGGGSEGARSSIDLIGKDVK